MSLLRPWAPARPRTAPEARGALVGDHHQGALPSSVGRGSLRRRVSLVSALVVAASLVGVMGAGPAGATNARSVTGVRTTGCAVAWDASSVLDTGLTNNDPVYPGLMTDLKGQPVTSYTNGGYISEVRPEIANGPGIFEVNHFYLNDTTGVWRFPIATDARIENAQVIIDIPAGQTVTSFDPTSTNAVMTRWGTPYSNYTWSSSASSMTALGGNRFEVDLGTLPAKSGTVFQLNFSVPAGTDLAQHFVANAQLTGTYDQGAAASCPVTSPPPPGVTPAPCTLNAAGQTVFPLPAADITVRDKWDDLGAVHLTNDPTITTDDYWRTTPPFEAEVNGDGWGPPDARSMRFYGAMNLPATNGTYTVTAAQGFTFAAAPTSVVTATPSGMGQVYANGYTQPVAGVSPVTISSDHKTLTMTIASLPAKSGWAFTVATVPDGTGKALVANETLRASRPSCTPPVDVPPTPAVPTHPVPLHPIIQSG